MKVKLIALKFAKDIRVDLDVRSPVFFSNYDYGDPEKSDISPGGGFYQNMHKYKSVKDFLNKRKKRKKKK